MVYATCTINNTAYPNCSPNEYLKVIGFTHEGYQNMFFLSFIKNTNNDQG